MPSLSILSLWPIGQPFFSHGVIMMSPIVKLWVCRRNRPSLRPNNLLLFDTCDTNGTFQPPGTELTCEDLQEDHVEISGREVVICHFQNKVHFVFCQLNFIVLFLFLIKYYHILFIIIVFRLGSDKLVSCFFYCLSQGISHTPRLGEGG